MSRAKIITKGQKNLSRGRNCGCILQPSSRKKSPTVNIPLLQFDCLSKLMQLNFIWGYFNIYYYKKESWMWLDHPLKSLTLALTQAAEEQSLPFSTVICNIVSVNVSCGYRCNCPEKTANNCSNKMEHIRITAGCPTASMPASFTPPVIMQFHKELNYCLSSTKQSLHI